MLPAVPGHGEWWNVETKYLWLYLHLGSAIYNLQVQLVKSLHMVWKNFIRPTAAFCDPGQGGRLVIMEVDVAGSQA